MGRGATSSDHRPLQHFQFGHPCLLKVLSLPSHTNRCFRGDLRPVFHTKKNRVIDM